MKFSCFFFQRNSSPWCSFTRSSSFSVIHMSVHIKNNVEKTRLFFFFSKSPGHSKLNLELHLGYHTCWLSYFFVGVPVVRTDGRSGGRTVTWVPKFLGCIGYQIFSPMVLRARESSAINVEIHGSERKLDDVSSTCGPKQAMLWLNNILNKTHLYDTRLLHQPPASIVLHLSVILSFLFRSYNRSTQHRPCLTRNLKRSNSGFYILANLIRRGLEKFKM